MSNQIMLRADHPGKFRRSARDDKGNILRKLEFEPGQGVDVSDDDMVVIADDIGPALVFVGKDRKPDWLATRQAALAVAKAKVAAAEKVKKPPLCTNYQQKMLKDEATDPSSFRSPEPEPKAAEPVAVETVSEKPKRKKPD